VTRLRTALPLAILTIVAVALVVGALALLRMPAPTLVLGAWLALGLSRSRLVDHWRGCLEALVALPAISVLVALVALVLARQAWIGAALFTLALAASVWLRRFGPAWRRTGGLVALPFTILLVAPGGGGVGPAAIAGVVALVVVVALRLAGRALGVVPPPDPEPVPAESTLRPIASTRMAVQLGLAVALAFVAGLLLLPEHWSWVVLTAYLVQSGTRGRADVLLKSGLRLAGALAGSLVAAPLAAHPALDGGGLLAVLLVVLAFALVLRAVSYAFWTAGLTLLVALLQDALGTGSVDLGLRLVAILLGAAISALCAWFVLPVRSRGVLRRRLADALAALQEQLAAPAPETAAGLRRALGRVDEVAPPFRLLARLRPLPVRLRAPGEWVRLVADCAAAADPLDAPASPEARRALGEARRALREPEALLPALERLRAAL